MQSTTTANLFKHNNNNKNKNVFKLIKENSIKESFCIEYCNWDIFFFFKKNENQAFLIFCQMSVYHLKRLKKNKQDL